MQFSSIWPKDRTLSSATTPGPECTSEQWQWRGIQFSQTVLIWTIQFSISIDLVYTELNIKTVLFQVIQFSISIQLSSIWSIDRTLSDATAPGHSGPGSNANQGVHSNPQSSSIAGTLPSDCLVSYPGHSFFFGGGHTESVEVQSVFYSPSRLGNANI